VISNSRKKQKHVWSSAKDGRKKNTHGTNPNPEKIEGSPNTHGGGKRQIAQKGKKGGADSSLEIKGPWKRVGGQSPTSPKVSKQNVAKRNQIKKSKKGGRVGFFALGNKTPGLKARETNKTTKPKTRPRKDQTWKAK